MRIKYFLITAVLATAILCFGTGANAQVDTQALIAQLQAQIAQLLAQIQVLQAQQGQTQTWCHTFNVNLRYGDAGLEVEALQTALEKEGIYTKEVNQPPHYDERLSSAVVEFQEKYASDILVPLGLKHGTGNFGPTTRKKMNALYGCGTTSTQPSITVTSPNGGERWEKGKTYDIKWTSKGIQEGVYISLENYNHGSLINEYDIIGPYSNYLSSIDGLNTFSWKIPTDFNWIGDNVLIKIGARNQHQYTTEQPAILDVSDNYFSIVAATTACTDTDNGKDYYTKGTAVDRYGTYTDLCYAATNQVFEYYCDSNLGYSQGVYYTCPNGCENGACKPTTQPSITVTSPNGGETWRIGETHNVTWTAGIPYEVGCHSSLSLQDNNGNTVGFLTSSMAKGQTSFNWDTTKQLFSGTCMTGATSFNLSPGTYRIRILSSGSGDSSSQPDITAYSNYFNIVAATACADSDGGKDYFTKGTAVDKYGTYTDLCYAATGKVFEYYCDSTLGYSQGVYYTCPNGCENGACKPSITVLSPNGGETWAQGQTYDIKWSINPNYYNEDIDIKLYDYSASSTTPNVIQIARFYNNPNLTTYRWTVSSNLIGSSYKIRVLGMVSGGVGESVFDLSDNYFSIVSPTVVCTDTDNGKNYNVEGTVTSGGITNTDLCYTAEGKIFEYYCNANGTSSGEFYFCPNGCAFGACKPAPIPCTDTDSGRDYNVKGTVTYGTTTYTDLCYQYSNVDPAKKDVIAEYYCDAGQPKGEWYTCPNGCENGACKLSPASLNNQDQSLASISDAIAKIVEEIKAMLNR